jgi:hypothetical protein
MADYPILDQQIAEEVVDYSASSVVRDCVQVVVASPSLGDLLVEEQGGSRVTLRIVVNGQHSPVPFVFLFWDVLFKRNQALEQVISRFVLRKH